MYIKSDFLTVPVSRFKLNSKAKNIILDNFPTKWVTDDVDGLVEVFDTLYVANDQHAINMTKQTGKILKLLGTSIESMQAQSWHGVASGWFKFRYVLPESTVISKPTIYEEIFRHTREGMKCTAQFNYVSYGTLKPASEIKADFAAGINLNSYGYLKTQVDSMPIDPETSYEYQDDQNWYIAYADIGEQAFTRSVAVKASTIGRDPIDGRVTYTTPIIMTYTRKADIPIDIDMDVALSRVISNNVYDERFLDNYFTSDPDSIFATVSTVEEYSIRGETTPSVSSEKFLRVDKVRAMKLKAFAKIIQASLHFDYRLKEVEWWMKVVAVVIVIIIIIVAAVITYFSAGIGSMLWPQAIAAIAAVVAITATVIAVALTLYLEELAKQGFVGGVGVIRNTILLAQDIAKYAGYVSMLFGVYGIIQSGFVTTGTAATSSAVPAGATKTGTAVSASGATMVTYTLPMSSSAIFAQVSSWISSAGNEYLQYIQSEVGSDLASKQAQVDAQEALMNDYSSPKAIVALQKDFDTYAAFDLNAKMDSMCYKMTQGLITGATTKYYD